MADFIPTDEEVELSTAEIYHTHLPKLEAAGFIEWDRDSSTITHGTNFEQVQPVVQLMYDHEDELPEGWP